MLLMLSSYSPICIAESSSPTPDDTPLPLTAYRLLPLVPPASFVPGGKVCIAVQFHLFQSTATHVIVCPFLELGDKPRFASVVSAPCLPPFVDQLLPRGRITHFSDSTIEFCHKYLDFDDEQKVFAMLTTNPLNDLIHISLYFGTVYVLNRPLTRPTC